jgi:hypothetical protein
MACTAQDVSIGSESQVVNLDQCYGRNTSCSRTESTAAPEFEARPCDTEPSGTLEIDFEVPIKSGYGDKLVVAPDGSLWTLERLPGEIVSLAHFSAEGELFGRNDYAHAGYAGDAASDADLAVDADGNAFLFASWIRFDGEEKDDFTQYTTLQRFGARADAVGAPIHLTGSPAANLAAGPGAYLTIAGDSPNNAHHGVVSRLRLDGEPVWMQNDVPSVGSGVGFGVCGVVVDAHGETTLVSERARDFEADESTFGLSHYDADGNELWSWTLPSVFAGGEKARLALGIEGNYIVSGVGKSKNIVQSFSPAPGIRWAFELPGTGDTGLTVDPETGSSIVGAGNGIAVIDKDGDACKVFQHLGGYYQLNSLVSSGGYVYFLHQYGFGRYKALPAQ